MLCDWSVLGVQSNVCTRVLLGNFKWPAKASVSPRCSPLGTFRVEERRSSVRNVPSGEERRETDVSAGYNLNYPKK